MATRWVLLFILSLSLSLAMIGSFSNVPSHASPLRHEVGQAWILKTDPVATRIHLASDEFCFVEFEERCYGGMMAPDSVLCVLEPLPEGQWPDECIFAVDCSITDPDGGHMFDGGGMHQSMMQRPVLLTVHYSAAKMSQMGYGHEDLCLVRLGSAGMELCGDAVQDPQASTFTLSTTAPTSAFAVVPQSALVGAETGSLSGLKSRY
jgi:hypothetical protein